MQLTPLPYPIRYCRVSPVSYGGWEYVAALTTVDATDGDEVFETLGLYTFYGEAFKPGVTDDAIVEGFIDGEWVRVVGERL